MKRKFILTIVSVVAAASLAVAQDSLSEARRWHEIGPSASGVSSLSPSPSNADVVDAVAYDKGLYRSLDGGETWDRLERRALVGWSGTNVALVGRDRRWVLAASGQGMAASDDGGETWRDTNQGMPGPQIVNITSLSTESPMLVTSTYNGIFHSPDFGKTWWRSSGDVEEFYWSRAGPVVPDPSDVGTVYTIGTFLFRSGDGGRSFSKVSDERYLKNIQVDPHNASRWFAISSTSGRVLRSHDQGQSWEEIGGGIVEFGNHLLFDPFTPDVILAVAGTTWPSLYHSTDGGETFLQISFDGRVPIYLLGLRFDPTTPDRIYGNRLLSEDGGFTWMEFPVVPGERFGFPGLFAVDPVQPGHLYGFLFYGIRYPDGSIEYVHEMVQSADAGMNWELFTKEGLPDDAYLTALVADRSGTYLYATVASEGRAHVYRILLRIPSPRRPGGRVP